MRKILLVILLVSFITPVGCKRDNFIDESNSINDADEILIKEFRSHHGYSLNELKNLEIEYLGMVDGYRIYYVPFEGDSDVLNDTDWNKDGYTFPVESHTRIIGIKENKLFVIGKLIHETSINIADLYNVLPSQFK